MLSGLEEHEYMGWSYRKRFKFGPIRVNLSGSGIGTSWGVRGFRVTHSSTGRRYVTLTLPGTGLSWRKTLGRSRRINMPRNGTPPIPHPPVQAIQSPPQLKPPSTTGTLTPPSVNGVPWWQQPGIKKGP